MTEQQPLPVEERPDIITVYTKPHCVQCTATHRHLESRGITPAVIDASQDEEGLARMKELGYLQAPVVIFPDGSHASGFRPDLLDKEVARLESLQSV